MVLPMERCAATFGEDEHTKIRLQPYYQHELGAERENGMRANMLRRNNEWNSSRDEWYFQHSWTFMHIGDFNFQLPLRQKQNI